MVSGGSLFALREVFIFIFTWFCGLWALTSPVPLHTVQIDPFLYYCTFAASRLLPLKAEKDIDEHRLMEWCVLSVFRFQITSSPLPCTQGTLRNFLVLRTTQIWGGNRLVKWKKHPKPQKSSPKNPKQSTNSVTLELLCDLSQVGVEELRKP